MGSATQFFGYIIFAVGVLMLMANMPPVTDDILDNTTANGSNVTFTFTGNIARTAEAGVVVQPVNRLTNITVRVANESSSTAAYIYNGTAVTDPLLAEKAAASGETVTFTASFTPGRKYLITGDGNSSQYDAGEDNKTVLPSTSEDINVTGGFLE